ncbi:glutamate receptor 2.5-like [Glycine soja]|uniref:glutamate receptor 2.5-like n=1 Tax=Glycine soja TaxID=3848 RepID=UPI00103DCD5B|nr:glutamate receptor 2.5-like [Glycine soja]
MASIGVRAYAKLHCKLDFYNDLGQLRPRFLRKGEGYYVGYQTGSFVKDVLFKQFKFDPSKLRSYSNSAEYYKALKSGSQGGGVAAIFDEVSCLCIPFKLQSHGLLFESHIEED